jgi:hypothetical protein
MLHVEGKWREKAPRIDVAVPGFMQVAHNGSELGIKLQRELEANEPSPCPSL